MIALGCLECLEVAQVGSGMITKGAHFRLVLCIQGFGRVPSPPLVRSDDWGIPMLCSISDLEDLNWLPGTGSCWMALSLSKSLPFLEVVGLNKSISSLDVCLDFKRPCICETKGKEPGDHAHILCKYCTDVLYVYNVSVIIYIYTYSFFVYFTTGGVKYLDDTIWRKSGWIIIFGANSPRLWCLDLPIPFWPTAFGAMVVCRHHSPYWEVYLTPWWSIGLCFSLYDIIQLNCNTVFVLLYTTQYISYIYILVLMTVFWYAEATTVTVWQTMRPIDSCFREGPLNSKQLGPGCNTAVSRACFETMQHEHTHNHDYSHMYCNMKRTHIYYDITNTSI